MNPVWDMVSHKTFIDFDHTTVGIKISFVSQGTTELGIHSKNLVWWSTLANMAHPRRIMAAICGKILSINGCNIFTAAEKEKVWLRTRLCLSNTVRYGSLIVVDIFKCIFVKKTFCILFAIHKRGCQKVCCAHWVVQWFYTPDTNVSVTWLGEPKFAVQNKTKQIRSVVPEAGIKGRDK